MIKKEVIIIITDNQIVYLPRVFLISKIDNIAISIGPTTLISANGISYHCIYFVSA